MSVYNRPPGVALVTDSSVCLPPETLARHRIAIVPLAFLIDGQMYHDGELSGPEFYSRLEAASRLPGTTSIAPGEFLDAFRRAREAGAKQVLCLTLHARFSGTHSAAESAREMAAEQLPGLEVRVVDTGGLAMTHGFAALAAARTLEAGGTVEEAEAAALAAGRGGHLVGYLDTTRYLAKSGRVPWIVHWAASFLQIKPVLAAHDGDVHAIGRSRTEAQAQNKVINYIARRTQPGEGLHIGVMHADAPDRARRLAARLQERFDPEEVIISELTSVMGVHTGPGFVGAAFFGPPPPAAARKKTKADYIRERDARLLEDALGPLPAAASRPALVLLTGLPGTGKSHVARELARRHSFAVVESDAMRRVLFPLHRNHIGKEHARLFAAIDLLLDRLLAHGLPVILDATNLREVHRAELYEMAERRGARLVVVRTVAPERVAKQRLAHRATQPDPHDVSDAGPEVYDKMRDAEEPIGRDHIVVDTAGDITPALDTIVSGLQAMKV